MTAITGAQALLHSAADLGIDLCFANPGTTEMSLVAAIDAPGAPRAVLGLFEGVCTGAADGFARILGRPAMTLTHLGPGFANGIANLHNARRARVPVVNVIGDHASWHLKYDAPLASDIASLARPVSAWYRSVGAATEAAADMADAIEASCANGGQIATLVFPMDHQAESIEPPPRRPATAPLRVTLAPVPSARIETIGRALADGRPLAFLLGATALTERGQRAAARIAAVAKAKLFAETFPSATERGGGLPDIDRLPYFPEAATAALRGAERVVLVGAREPVSYFGYPGIPAELVPPGTPVDVLAAPHEDGAAALEALADRLAAPREAPGAPVTRLEVADGALTPVAVGRLLANALPAGAIVSVEGGTCGYPFATAAAHAERHTILTNTGGAIGQGLPVAVGAALAAPSRRTVVLQSDGSAQYTIQALWTLARESLPVVVLIASNQRYAILQNELARAGIDRPGPNALALTQLSNPAFDWIALARGYGVPAERVQTVEALRIALTTALADCDGPCLIEMAL
jgi:acetolactate synthase I/II/III large subunit